MSSPRKGLFAFKGRRRYFELMNVCVHYCYLNGEGETCGTYCSGPYLGPRCGTSTS